MGPLASLVFVCVCECDVAKMVPSTDPGAADAQSLGIWLAYCSFFQFITAATG